MAREDAPLFGKRDEPVQAAQAYEQAIQESTGDLDLFLNLAVLYFVCTDPGYASHHRLSDDFVKIAWDKANKVLDEAESRFGTQAEIIFWRHYFRFVVLGEEPFVDTCRQLAHSSPSLVPYFYLFTSPGGWEYRREAEQLLELVRDGTTAKKRYIRSILKDRLGS